MDASELPGYLAEISGRVSSAAKPVVMAMAERYEREVKRNLSKTSHPRFTRTPSPPGGFPSLMTGRLRRSVLAAGPYGGGGIAMAEVAPHTIYAGVQEYGHTMHGRPLMHFYNMGRWWSLETVHVPSRPYMRPTTAELVASGSLTVEAEAAFEVYVWHH